MQIKAACQPQRSVTAAISIGAMKAEALEPELKMPIALARSSAGNHRLWPLRVASGLAETEQGAAS